MCSVGAPSGIGGMERKSGEQPFGAARLFEVRSTCARDRRWAGDPQPPSLAAGRRCVPVTIQSRVFGSDPRGPRPRERLPHRDHPADRHAITTATGHDGEKGG